MQLPDSVLILQSSSRHSCTYTYVLYVRPKIFGGKISEKAPSDVRSRYGRLLVQNFTVYDPLEMAWTLRFGAEDMYFKYFLMITWFQCRMKFLRYLSLSF